MIQGYSRLIKPYQTLRRAVATVPALFRVCSPPWKIQGDSRIFKAHKALSNFAPRFSFRPSARGGKPSAVRPLRLLRQRKRRAARLALSCMQARNFRDKSRLIPRNSRLFPPFLGYSHLPAERDFYAVRRFPVRARVCPCRAPWYISPRTNTTNNQRRPPRPFVYGLLCFIP